MSPLVRVTPGPRAEFVVSLAVEVRPVQPAERSLMFLFFSNRLGCAGSLLVSLVATVFLILILRLL